MSENIQSISQGTYTIGQTSATNFVAGPGIKIDEPSEGVVRIGNDETVLWSGTGTTSFSLSEAPSAFNQLLIKFDEMGNGNRYGYMWCNDTTRNPLGAVGINFLTNDTSDGIHINASRFTVAGTNLTMDYCVKKWLTLGNGTQTWGSTGTLGSTKVFEIRGINRISGSNA